MPKEIRYALRDNETGLLWSNESGVSLTGEIDNALLFKHPPTVVGATVVTVTIEWEE